jgi:hypothetical protein
MTRSMHACAGFATRAGLTAAFLLLFVVAGCGGGHAADGANASAASSGGHADGSANACSLLTKADATSLFGEPAVSRPADDLVPGQAGRCIWHWDNPDSTVAENKSVQLTVWNGPQYYNPPGDSQSFAIGDRGYVQAHGQFKSVTIGWVQHGMTYSLVYDHNDIKIASGAVNTAPDSIDSLEKLAKTISGRA